MWKRGAERLREMFKAETTVKETKTYRKEPTKKSANINMHALPHQPKLLILSRNEMSCFQHHQSGKQ